MLNSHVTTIPKLCEHLVSFTRQPCRYDNKHTLLLRAVRRAATLILTRSRGYICVRNLDYFHLVGNDLRYMH